MSDFNPYGGVSSRYMDPPHEKPAANYLPPKEVIPKSGQYRNVDARYMQKKEAEPKKPREIPPSPFLNEDEHKKLAKKTIGNVSSRFFREELYHVDEKTSPRHAVEQKIEAASRELAWRNDIENAKAKSFDDIRRQTEKRWANLPAKKKSQSHSAVREYIRNGSPIRHPTMSHITDDGNVAAEERRIRAGTPPPKTWNNTFITGKEFSKMERATMSRQGYQMEQRKIKEKNEKRNSLKVKPGSVPRVATLSPAAIVAESMSRAGSVRASNKSSSPMQHFNRFDDDVTAVIEGGSPTYEIEDSPHHNNGNEDEDVKSPPPKGSIHFSKKQ